MFRRKTTNADSSTKDTLIIVGNGFDIWQGLHTYYKHFEIYYHEHLDEILKKLRIKKYKLYKADKTPKLDEDGRPVTFSDVELFYGDPFHPNARLPYAFWNRFEDSLDKLDTQRLSAFFGKEKDDLKNMQRGSRNALRILRQAFCDWVTSIELDGEDAGYRFGNNCLFINFNYTDTLIKRFHIDERNEYHIHGDATDPESIIFGHATHPEYPYPALHQFGGRFRELYFIEDMLYHTDKHVEDNFGDLCIFLALHGVMVEEIKHIYVLGHSFGDADMGYFKHIINATQGIHEELEPELSEQEKDYLDYIDPMEEIHMNIQYAMHNTYRSMGIIPDAYPYVIEGDAESEKQLRLEVAVVHRRFLAEQYERDKQRDKEFYRLLRRTDRKHRTHRGSTRKESLEGESGGKENGTNKTMVSHPSPQWHISYYSDEDRLKIEAAMQKLKCKNYTLYPTIDECLARFKI